MAALTSEKNCLVRIGKIYFTRTQRRREREEKKTSNKICSFLLKDGKWEDVEENILSVGNAYMFWQRGSKKKMNLDDGE